MSEAMPAAWTRIFGIGVLSQSTPPQEGPERVEPVLHRAAPCDEGAFRGGIDSQEQRVVACEPIGDELLQKRDAKTSCIQFQSGAIDCSLCDQLSPAAASQLDNRRDCSIGQ